MVFPRLFDYLFDIFLDYNGVILYNSEKTGPSGDMVSLALVDGIPEFRYILGSGSAVVIRGDTPLTLNEWHKIKIIRSRKDGLYKINSISIYIIGLLSTY